MKLDVTELKRLAQAANSAIEPFTKTADGERWAWRDVCDLHLPELRAFKKVASPSAILALIKRLETLEAEHKGTVRLTLEQAKLLELAGTEDRSYGEKCWCPACGTGVPYEYDGDRWFIRPQPIPHREDCWLATAIKEAQRE